MFATFTTPPMKPSLTLLARGIFFNDHLFGNTYASGIVLGCGGVRMEERGSWPPRAYGAVQDACKTRQLG